MLEGAECDKSLLRVRAAASSPACDELFQIRGFDWPLSGEDLSQRAISLGAVCHRHCVGGYRVTRLLDFGLESSEIKPYAHRILALDADNACIHGTCRLTAVDTCT
jgi:hypothetical protein